MPQPLPEVVGIYARKSVFVESSESVSNQVKLCREHCERIFSGCSFIVYDEDEGFSGKNTDRPSFQRLVADIKARKITVLCCYRLDRVSRSVRDFCTLLDDLQRYGVSFLSLREHFDTSTPMGRAMLYLASVFSQLERETIAERVMDSLYQMAKTGRWLGGVAPKGFESVPLETVRDGVERKQYKLSPLTDQLAEVVDIYSRFAEFGSVTKTLSYCLTNGIKSQNGNDFSRTTLRALLSNPTYCTADDAAWRWFSDGDYNLCATRDDFDGIHGLMPYNRTHKIGDLTARKPTDEWIIAVGQHLGAVPGSLWVTSQRILEANKDLGASYKAPRTETALLSGVLRCARCGSYMRPRMYGKPLADGSRRFHYICSCKVDTRKQLCDIKNAPMDVDAMVVKQLKELALADPFFDSVSVSGASPALPDAESTIRRLQSDIESAQKKLDNIVDTIAGGVPASARPRFFAQMEELDAEIVQKQKAIAELTDSAMAEKQHQDLQMHISALLESFEDFFALGSYDERRRAIRSIVDSVVWDGENITINVLGAKTLPK